jgi:hypothetical protein
VRDGAAIEHEKPRLDGVGVDTKWSAHVSSFIAQLVQVTPQGHPHLG